MDVENYSHKDRKIPWTKIQILRHTTSSWFQIGDAKSVSLKGGEQHFIYLTKLSRYFQIKRVCTDFWWIFLENTLILPGCVSNQASNIYLLVEARFEAAIQLMWACGAMACALRVTSEYSFTDLGRTDSWVGCWLVACRVSDRIQAHVGIPPQDSKHCALSTRPHHPQV